MYEMLVNLFKLKHTLASKISLILVSLSFPFLCLTNIQILPMLGHDRTSFSINTLPINPVAPVMKTTRPLKNSGIFIF